MSRSWTIGSKPECDIVLDVPKVSGRHCRLTLEENGYVLEDLGSTNGTYVNGERVSEPRRITRDDTVTLGLLTPMPWPPDDALPSLSFQGQEMVIGRASGSDLVLDFPMVSSRHARVFRADGQTWIEDLGSANGTFVNARRVDGKSVVATHDLIGLGSYTLVLTDESPKAPAEGASPIHEAPPVVADWIPTIQIAASTRPTHGPVSTVPPARRLAALLAQAPLAAVLMVMAMKTDAPVAATLALLALAAFWFGLSDAVLGGLFDARRLRQALTLDGASSLGMRLLVLAGLCVWQCGLTWVLVAKVAALKGPVVPAVAITLLASAVGAALGLVIVSLSLRPAMAWSLLAVVMIPLCLLGGGAPGSVSTRTTSWLGTVSNSLPTRWAFEGLLLLESERRQPVHDLAEEFFPAGSERMGVRADVMALVLMMLGLTAVAGFISHERERRQEQEQEPLS